MVSAIEKIQIAKKKIEDGDRSGSLVFGTLSELYSYVDIAEQTFKRHEKKIYDAGFSIESALTTDEKIQIAKEKIEAGDRGGSFVFDTLVEFTSYLGIAKGTFQKHREKICSAGFSVESSIPIEQRVRVAKEKIEAGDRGGSFIFGSLSEFCSYTNISETSFANHREEISAAGFGVASTIPVDQKIQIAKEKIEAGDRGGSFAFDDLEEISIYIGLSVPTIQNHKEEVQKTGFSINSLITIDEKIQIAKEKIEAGDRSDKFVFASKTKLCSYVGISKPTLAHYEKKISEAGLVIGNSLVVDRKARGALGKSCKDESCIDSSIPVGKRIRIAKERIEMGDREGSFIFDKVKELCLFIGISEASYHINVCEIESAGFSAKNSLSVEQRIQIAKEKIEAGDRRGSFVFDQATKLYKYIGIAETTYDNYKDKLREIGFKVRSASNNVSRNLQLSLDDCRLWGVKLESIELLPQLSQEFFSRHIRADVEYLDLWNVLGEDITSDFSKKEIIDKTKSAVLSLISDGKADYSMLELKLELFHGGVYFSEDSMVGALVALGEDIIKSSEDSIYKRLRLCNSFVEKGFIQIEYTEKLPPINNSEDGNVIIDQSINNKRDFLRLWREYTLYSAKNNITGHVSKSKLPDNWRGSLNALFEENSSYQRAYLLDDKSIKYLEQLSYEGILAMCQFGSKQSKKGLTRMHQSIHARCIGFFLYLNRKKLALFHPKYFILTGASSVSDIARKTLGGHVVLSGLEKALKMSNAPSDDLGHLQKKNVHLHALKLAGSILRGCDLKTISSEDIHAYLEHSSQELVSGTIQHATFVLTLLRLLGNRGAIEKDKVFDIEEEIRRLMIGSDIEMTTFSKYKGLLEEMLDVVRHIFREGKTNDYVKSYLRQTLNLMKYLSVFPKKLSRREMSEALNTITLARDKESFDAWAAKHITRPEYLIFTQRMYVLFESISNEEYAKLYNKEWRLFKNNENRTLIREGMEPIVYETLQRVALYDSPSAHEYPFYKTTPDGQIVDLSWWRYDFSPVPVICNWLIIKLTRRKIAVRHLDVNTFLQYENGQLKSILVNTDKNRNSNDREISIHLLRFIFTDKELRLLEKYVEYIKNVYSGMARVSYSNSANSFEKIMPLFPHHKKNSVIAEAWVDGYYNKTMLKTEFLLKRYVAEGEFDRYFEVHEREAKKKMLSGAKLLKEFPKEQGKRTGNLPKTIEELDSYSLASYKRYFTTIQGIHNMRHAGISALGAKLPLVYVRMIAGHSDINTTARVYFHANEDIIAKEVLSSEFNDFLEPAKMGSSFVSRTTISLMESGDPKAIEEELQANDFMSCPREIEVGQKREWVENGVELASAIHPASWTIYNHGICPANQCPLESRGCCALCPYLIFSSLHIKGVAYQLNKCLIDIALIGQKVAMDATKNINTSREELNLKHQQKMEEMMGWFEVMNSITEKLSSSNTGSSSGLSLSRIARDGENVVSFRSCGIDESMVEQLVDAAKLKIDNEETDNYIARISNKILRTAIRNYDPGTLRKMEKEGIKWFIDEYGKKAFGEKKEYLLRYVNLDKPTGDSGALGSDLSVMELLSVD